MTAPILGARNVEQLVPSLAAADWPDVRASSTPGSRRCPRRRPRPPTAAEEQKGVAYNGSAEKYK